ncbi:MAG: cytochrome c biogenesis protein ResB [Chloroflexia bacterium]|nr:cytochrome c biogenesis protein ResB [Chloroflexia bacterium]
MTHVSLDRPAVNPRALPELVVDRIWRFFCSVRAAIAEIAILALLVLAGTLRGSSVPRTIADTLPFATPLVERWYAWDVFRSLPFASILTVLAVAIAICTINRAPGIWQAIAHPTVVTTHGFLRNAETSATFASALSAPELASQLQDALRAGRYRTIGEERSGEVHLYADRWRYSRLATFPFHLALIMILAGGIVGAAWGFRDNDFIIPEGSVRELGHGTGLTVRLDDFSEVYREDGTPLVYRSDVTIMKNGDTVNTGSMTVNNPLTFGDVVFYQSGFGQAVALKIEDSAGEVLFDDALPLGPFQSKLNPDAPAARMDLVPAGVAMSIVAPDENPANAPELDTLRLRPGDMFFMIRPLGADSPIAAPIGATVSQGESIELGDLSLTFVRERRFSVLQVARNPGIPLFIAASVLLVGGLAVTFYFPHRRIRAIVSPTPGGSEAQLAPVARRDWSAKRVFEQVAGDVGRRIGLESHLRMNEPSPIGEASYRVVAPP